MTKKQLLSALALSTITLAQSGFVSADEVIPVDPSSPSTEVVTPIEPSAPVETPTEPTQPVETPTEPTTPPVELTPTDPSVSVQPVEPSTSPSTEVPKEEPIGPEVSKEEMPATTEISKPEQPVESIPREDPKSDNEGAKKDVPKEPQGDGDILLKPIEEPTVEQPIVGINGDRVVGTQDSQLLIQKSDGTIQAKSASEVGATVNSDGTIALKTSTGELKRLPQTGEETNFISFIGIIMVGLIGFFTRKKI